MWAKVRAVWARELLDTVRDKRTLYMMVLLPIFIMPVVMLVGPVVMVRQQEALQQETAVVAFHGGPVPGELTAWLEAQEGFAVETGTTGEDALARLQERLEAGEIQLIVSVAGYAAALWAAEEPVPVELIYYANSSRSSAALQRFQALLQAFGAQVGAARLMERGLSPNLVQPFTVTGTRDITPEEQFTGRLLGMFVPFFIVVWAVMGGMYTAIDAAAGEKERNSLEPLVMVPAPTSAIVLGKFLAVATVTFVAVMLLVTSSVVSFLYVLPQLLGDEVLTVSLKPGYLLYLLAFVALLVALTSAVELGLSVYSKSYREAQAYISALVFIIMLPSMYLGFAEIEDPAMWTYAVPVLNVLFVVRHMLAGSLPDAAPMAIAFVSLFIAAGVALWWAQRAFRDERVIFRA